MLRPMLRGSLASILVAPAAGAPMLAVEAALAVAGKGLEGDRYFLKQGTFFKEKPDYEVTLIEAEAIEAVRSEAGIELAAGQARRNLVTRGVALNHLVGRRFRIGEVLLQ